MTLGDWFVLAVILLQLGAAVAYGLHHQWPQLMVWGGVGLANVGVLWLSLR